MIERLRELEHLSRRLEPDPHARARLREPIVEYAERFLDELGRTPAYRSDTTAARDLRDVRIPEEPVPPEHVVALLDRCVDTPGLKPSSAGHLAYIPGGGLYPSSLGDYIAAITNHYAGIAYAGPGAVEMENLLIRWMAEVVGFPEGSGGNLASGGSVANLIAVVTAREARGLRAAEYSRAVVYGTEQMHHCLEKALHIAGLGECQVRHVPMDDGGRMRPTELAAAVAEDRRAGRRNPWMVIASAGTTDVGAVDPLDEIGEVAREEGLWYHVDAAYGGFFALCPEFRPKLRGMAQADSLVLDPHKGLFLPYGLGAVLVRDDETLRGAHTRHAHYLQDTHREDGGAPSPADRSPELTKHWRAPRMWLPLMLFGTRPFRAALEEKALLARYFRERALEMGFEVGPEPDLSVVHYRWVPAEGDADAFNRALLRAILEDGHTFISSTTLNGTFVLRLAALCFRTHLYTVDRYLAFLRQTLEDLGETPLTSRAAPEAKSVP